MRIIRFHGVCCTLNEMKPKFNIFQKTSFAVTTNNRWTEMTSRIICREISKYDFCSGYDLVCEPV